MIRSITTAERAALCIKPDAIVFVTDDDPERLPLYNCFGSVLYLAVKIGPMMGTDLSAIDLLRRYGFRPRGPIGDTEGGVALYRGSSLTKWHVANHLGFGWYESKCYEGLRIVHRSDAFTKDEEGYGEVESCWEFTGTIEEFKETISRDTAHRFEDFDPVMDSGDEFFALLEKLQKAKPGATG